MITNMSYGSWARRVEHATTTLEDSVQDALSDGHAGKVDFDAIVADYRAAINAALPAGVQLCGSEFYGPAYEADCDFAGFDLDEDGLLDINAIICAIDFWAIVEKHSPS